MYFYSKTLKRLLSLVPGKKTIGIYRFLPFYFCFGALLEYSMINWNAFGSVNFYKTYKKNRARKIAEESVAALES